MVKHCYDELRAYHVSLLCCGESAVLIFPEFESCVVLQAYLKKSVCRQMITFSSLMDKGHSPIVNNCPLFIVLQTALLFLLV